MAAIWSGRFSFGARRATLSRGREISHILGANGHADVGQSLANLGSRVALLVAQLDNLFFQRLEHVNLAQLVEAEVGKFGEFLARCFQVFLGEGLLFGHLECSQVYDRAE